MKKQVWFLGVLLFSASVFAEAPNEMAPPVGHPCHGIHAACAAAGYVKGGHKQGKGIWKDCIDPILAGQTVPNVSVPAAEVAACQAKRAAKGK